VRVSALVWALDIILVGTLLLCCYTDLKERKVFNLVLFPTAVLALIIHLILQGGMGAWFWGKGTFTGMALLFIPFVLGGIGAGDVKLLGVVGSFKGAAFVFKAFLCAALLGGVFSLFFLWQRKELRETLGRMGGALKLFLYSCFRVWNFKQLEDNEAAALPYGLAISLGSMICLVGELW
jgi:prepilin peptidase CpaA